jgi:tetratricopeptide (TPR) repeat protein
LRATLLLPLIFFAALSAPGQTPQPAAPQQQPQAQTGQLDASASIFAVLAAVNAAGYDDQIDSPTNHPLRKALRDHLAAQNLDSVYPLRRFVRDHRKATPGAELSKYISYALLLNGPPDFGYRYPVQALPAEVADLDGLTPLLVTFYKEAHLDDLWKRVQPYFDQAIAQYHEPVSLAVLQANAYVRNPTSGYLGRRFQIYVDLLGAPNQVQMRSYADDYFVVVTPAGELPIGEIQHAYLHYLIDPLMLKFSKQMQEKHALGDYAQGAPALEDSYKSDFILLSTECMIKAVESRIQRKPALVDQALREGFVLTPAFAEQLAVYEKQDQAFRLYLPEVVQAIDLKREEKRLANIDFASERAVRTITTVTAPKPPELTGAAKELEEAEQAYSDRNLGRAKEVYLRLLQESVAEKSIHAKAYYGLARIAVLERDPELGDRLFRKVLDMEPDASTKSWSLLYLGRLADSQGDREQAQQNYQAALAVEGAPDSVRKAAEQGLKEAFIKK